MLAKWYDLMLKKLLYIYDGVHCTGQRQTNIIAAVEQLMQ